MVRPCLKKKKKKEHKGPVNREGSETTLELGTRKELTVLSGFGKGTIGTKRGCAKALGCEYSEK